MSDDELNRAVQRWVDDALALQKQRERDRVLAGLRRMLVLVLVVAFVAGGCMAWRLVHA